MPPEPPRWNRLDPDVRRGEIVAAARHLFATRPYASVSITAIAEHAHVSRALVTHYFGGKRELFLTVLRDLTRERGMAPHVGLGLPIEQVVERNVDAWLDFMEANRGIAFAISSVTTLDRDPEVAGIVDDVRDGIVDRMLLNHFATTDVPPNARLVLRAFTGLAQVAVGDWLTSGRASREQVRALMLNGLLALVRDVLPRLPEG